MPADPFPGVRLWRTGEPQPGPIFGESRHSELNLVICGAINTLLLFIVLAQYSPNCRLTGRNYNRYAKSMSQSEETQSRRRANGAQNARVMDTPLRPMADATNQARSHAAPSLGPLQTKITMTAVTMMTAMTAISIMLSAPRPSTATGGYQSTNRLIDQSANRAIDHLTNNSLPITNYSV
jgi:hypothetical protein